MSRACCPAGSAAGAPSFTFDTLAVVRMPVLWLVTATPTYAVDPSGIVSLPIVVQAAPSADAYAVTRVPARTSRTQRGAAGPAVCDDVPPSARRRWNAVPKPDET